MADIKSLSKTLPGTWELVSRIDVTDRGERRIDPSLGADPVALLIYDRAGHFAAQFMKRDRSTNLAADAPIAGANNSRAQGGYDAYFGAYVVDDATGVVTQRLAGALSAENVGLVLHRAMRVENDRLTIELRTTAGAGEPVTRTLIWQRVG
jgi:Lipocalin-like domain